MKKILLLGSGELGKELTISLQRFGCYIIACDKYKKAPATLFLVLIGLSLGVYVWI